MNKKYRVRSRAKADPANFNHCDVQRKWRYPTLERLMIALDSHWGMTDKQGERGYHCPFCLDYHVTSKPFRPSKHYCYDAKRWKFANRREAERAAFEVDRDPEEATRCRKCRQFHFEPELEPIVATEPDEGTAA